MISSAILAVTVLIGLVAGVLGAILGLGGGVIVVPALEFAMPRLGHDLTIQQAIAISQFSVLAVGLSGEDGQLFRAQRRGTTVDGADVDLGLVGEVASVRPEGVRDLIDAGRIPVVATVAPDDQGQVHNVNADTAAAALAVGGEFGALPAGRRRDLRQRVRGEADGPHLPPAGFERPLSTQRCPEALAARLRGAALTRLRRAVLPGKREHRVGHRVAQRP